VQYFMLQSHQKSFVADGLNPDRWEAYSAPPDPLAELRGPLCGAQGREGKEEKGKR